MNKIKEMDKPIKNVYIISRTSNYTNASPCEEAYKVKIKSIDRRNVDDPSKLNYQKNNWYLEGTNHRVENGNICRDFGWIEVWAVKINNLDDFIKKYGECVLSIDEGFMKIEIYDDYRE